MGLQEVRDWYDDLELRKKIEENQSIVSIGLIVLIIFSLGLTMCQIFGGGSGPGSQEVQLVYFDTTNQTIRIVEHEYSAQSAQPASPLEGTDDVFMASVFACEECPKGQIKDGMSLGDLKANGMFVGWLEKFDPEVSEEARAFGEGAQYRSLERDRWYKVNEKGYEAIRKRVFQRCPTALICLP